MRTLEMKRSALAIAAALAVAGGSLAGCAATEGLERAGSSTQDNTKSSEGPESASVSATAKSVSSSAAAGSVNWQGVAEKVRASVVAIQVSSGQGGGQGSGVVFDDSGHIVTNHHVVAGGQRIRVILPDGRVFSDVETVGTDPATDLAVLRVKDAGDALPKAVFGKSAQVKVAEPVMALGTPLGLADTVTTGIVSALDRPVVTDASPDGGGMFGTQPERVVTNAIQTDAAINPGNSGGALVNAAGEVIGINSSIASLSGGQGKSQGSIGLGFAIPSDEVKRVAASLIASGSVEHAWLGVTLGDATVKAEDGERLGAAIGEVVPGTPAEKAELKADDVVVAIDGETVRSAQSLIAQIRERAPQDSAELTVVRDGKTVKVTVTLGVKSNSL